MPIVWDLLHTEPSIRNLVFIGRFTHIAVMLNKTDSDALFRDPYINVYRHLDMLSGEKNFGVLTNEPYENGPNSGYWFLRRHPDEIAAGGSSAEEFVLDWWNEDCQDAGAPELSEMYDQATMRQLMGGDYLGGDCGLLQFTSCS